MPEPKNFMVVALHGGPWSPGSLKTQGTILKEQHTGHTISQQAPKANLVIDDENGIQFV